MSQVTIVVPTYNKAAYIQRTLESIHAQTYRNWQLLIIDDASTDQTVAIARRNSDPARTRIIVRKVNQGICHVLNEALKHIRTEYFIQVDGDDWIERDAVQVLYNAMSRQPATTALAYGNTVHWHEHGGQPHYHKTVKQRSFASRYDFAVYDPMVQPRFYRTSCVRRVGGWEIDKLTGGRKMEDRRMLLRLLDHYRFVYVNRDLYHFRYHQSNLSHDRNAAVYNKLRRFYTEKALQRWGGHYRCEMVGPPELWQSIRLVSTRRKT